MKRIVMALGLGCAMVVGMASAEDHSSATTGQSLVQKISVHGPESNWNEWDNVTIITVDGTECWVDNTDAAGKALVAFAMFAYTNQVNVVMRYLNDVTQEKRGRKKCAQIATQ